MAFSLTVNGTSVNGAQAPISQLLQCLKTGGEAGERLTGAALHDPETNVWGVT